MSSEKTPKLSLHKWAATDYVQRTEFNENFTKLDEHAEQVTQQLAETKKKTDWVSVLSFEHLIPNKNEIEENWDWADALQAAFNEALNTGKALRLPPKKLRYTKPFGIDIALTEGKSMPSIIGEKASASSYPLPIKQDGSILYYDGIGGEALKIKAQGNYFFGGELRNFSIIKKDGYQSTDGSIGLSLKRCVDYRIYNVVCIGFDTGFKNDYGWSWDAFGLTCVHNRLGILLDDNSNACGLNGVQAHQNKIGVKIISGANINIDRITLEGQDHGVVITQKAGVMGASNIKISNAYAEVMSKSMFTIGMDENGVVSPNSVSGVILDNLTISTPGIIPIQLDNCSGISINGANYGQTNSLFASTINTKHVTVDSFRSQATALQFGRYTKENRIGMKNTSNLIVDGLITLPDLSDFRRGGLNAVFDTSAFPNERVVRIEVPNGTNNNYFQRKMIKIHKWMVGKVLSFSGVAQKDSDMTAKFIVYTPEYSGIAGAAVEISTKLSAVGFSFLCPDVEYLNISISVTNTSGALKNVYIKSMVLVESNTGIINPSTIDYLSGLSGVVSATTTGVEVPLNGWNSNMYEVILTNYGNYTSYVTKADNKFTVISSVNGQVSYLIIPKVGIPY